MPEIIMIPPKQQECRKRAAAYCRVSTGREEQAESLQVQIAYYESQIKNNPNWEFVGVYFDTKSGLQARKRDGLQTLLKKCNNGEIDIILVKSVSRFGRNLYESLLMLRHLKSIGVDVWCEQENLRLLDYTTESDFSMLLLIAQAESEAKSENIKFSLKHGFKTGTSKLYDRICYGYAQDENGSLVIDEPKAAIVRTIFELYFSGCSLSGIAKELYRCKIPSPTGKEKWSSETISKLLSNEKLSGDVLGQKTFVENFLDRRQVKNNGERDRYFIKNHHEPIIPKELFKAVQEEKRKRSNMTVRNNGHKGRKSNRYSNDILSGKIICSECGANYRKITRNTKIVWRCANRVEHGSRICKNSRTITNDEIQMKLAERLLLYQFDEEACRKYLKEITIGADVVVTVGPFNENDLLKLREYQMSRAAIKGDRKALDLLYEESYKKIRDFIKERLYRAGLHTYADLMRDYEDVCQDTFLKSFVILEKYHGSCRFSSWVAKISFYEISHRLQRLRRRRERLEHWDITGQ